MWLVTNAYHLPPLATRGMQIYYNIKQPHWSMEYSTTRLIWSLQVLSLTVPTTIHYIQSIAPPPFSTCWLMCTDHQTTGTTSHTTIQEWNRYRYELTGTSTYIHKPCAFLYWNIPSQPFLLMTCWTLTHTPSLPQTHVAVKWNICGYRCYCFSCCFHCLVPSHTSSSTF